MEWHQICLIRLTTVYLTFFVYFEQESNSNEKQTLLTIPNIQYIVQGLDVLLQNNLDGDNRIRVIELRDELLSYITGFFSDYR